MAEVDAAGLRSEGPIVGVVAIAEMDRACDDAAVVDLVDSRREQYLTSYVAGVVDGDVGVGTAEVGGVRRERHVGRNRA